MAYNENYGNNRNQRNNWDKKVQKNEPIINKIEKPLSTYYTDAAQLYLPNGKAYECAKNFKGIPPHQLRKILNGVKQALLYGENNLNKARKQMFVMVPMTAYNKGRDKKLTPLYNFIQENINEKSIVSIDDIKIFDELFTSIVAYHKTM